MIIKIVTSLILGFVIGRMCWEKKQGESTLRFVVRLDFSNTRILGFNFLHFCCFFHIYCSPTAKYEDGSIYHVHVCSSHNISNARISSPLTLSQSHFKVKLSWKKTSLNMCNICRRTFIWSGKSFVLLT